MPAVKVLNRGFTLKVNGIDINGIREITFSRSKKDSDTTTWEDGGNETHLVTHRSAQISLRGKWLEDLSTGDRDSGQAALETLATKFGQEAIGSFTLTTPGGKTYSFYASVEIGDTIGAEDETADWSVTLTVTGGITVS